MEVKRKKFKVSMKMKRSETVWKCQKKGAAF
jgi:hypothetical protein